MKDVEVWFGFIFSVERRFVKGLGKARDGGKVVSVARVPLCNTQVWFCSVLQYL